MSPRSKSDVLAREVLDSKLDNLARIFRLEQRESSINCGSQEQEVSVARDASRNSRFVGELDAQRPNRSDALLINMEHGILASIKDVERVIPNGRRDVNRSNCLFEVVYHGFVHSECHDLELLCGGMQYSNFGRIHIR